MSLHIIKNYSGKHLVGRGGKVIDTTLKATRLCKDTIADNLRLGDTELITVIVISPSIFRHFHSFLEHPAVSMEGVQQ